MISQTLFDEKFIKMCTLCGFHFKKSETLEAFYESLKYTDERTLLLAFKEMTEDPPAKLNLKHIKSFISIVKNRGIDGTQSSWNGKECSEPDCIDGLVMTKHGGNSYVWKCPVCRSYDCKSYPWFNRENVEALEQKLAKQFERPDFIGDSKLDEKPEPVKTDIGHVVLNVAKNLRQENRKDLA